MFRRPAMLFVASLVLTQAVAANGLDRNGVGAKSMGKAGASLADMDDGVNSMSHNPAALGHAEQAELLMTIAGAWGEGSYRNSRDESGSLNEEGHILPELVLRVPIMDGFSVGFSIIPDSSRAADWYFRDPRGGVDGNTTYGSRHHESSIVNVRTALGIGWRMNDQWSVGGSLGLVYNQNGLHTPYTFQSHPALAGMKTLLDLETDGYGVNGDIAMAWQPTKRITVALAYRSPAQFKTEGTARGDIGRQLRSLGLGVPGQFEYDADIEPELPQKVALGGSWQALPRLRLSGQVEWVNWSRAYDNLEVRLSNGSNAGINGLLGSNRIDDTIPLSWEDRFVYRTGVEFDLTQSLAFRAGYAYGASPVPNETLLPMTAAISEHTLAFGFGWKSGPVTVDLAYQHDLEANQKAGRDGITGTEYDDSEISLRAHWVGLTLGFSF